MGVVKGAWDLQGQIEERARHLGKGRYGRVLRMARKPTRKEYTKVLQITGLGIVLIGLVGFAVYFLMTYVPRWLAPLIK